MGCSQLSTTTSRTREGCSGSAQSNQDLQEDGLRWSKMVH